MLAGVLVTGCNAGTVTVTLPPEGAETVTAASPFQIPLPVLLAMVLQGSLMPRSVVPCISSKRSAIRGIVWGFNRRSPPYWPGRRIEHAVAAKEKSGITRCARPTALIPFFPRPPLCARF